MNMTQSIDYLEKKYGLHSILAHSILIDNKLFHI